MDNVEYKLNDVIYTKFSDQEYFLPNEDISNFPLLEFKIIGLYKNKIRFKENQLLIVPNFSYKINLYFRVNCDLIDSWKNDSNFITLVDDIDNYLNKSCAWIFYDFVHKYKPDKSNSKLDFCICKVCKNSSPMAEINQPDGTFVCWSCRKYPIRAFY